MTPKLSRTGERIVYMTKGGWHYHLTLRCRTLRSGQAKAAEAGYHLHAIDEIPESRAAALRKLCRNCRHNDRFDTLA